MTDSKHTIFISYRRSDNPGFVERIRDWFIMRYGREHVFMDFDSIPPFVKFADFIREKVQESDALIAIIGPEWLNLLKQKEAAGEEDYVRIEIALALQMKKVVAPICIMAASMPDAIHLPDDLRPMLAYNAAFLNPGRDFLDNIQRIVEAAEREIVKLKTVNISLPDRSMFSSDDYFNSGLERNVNDYDSKITDFTEAINLNPQFSEAYFHRGIARNAKSDFNGAMADFTEAIRLNQNYAEAFYHRGNIFRVKGDFRSAIAEYSAAIRLNAQFVDAYYGRGVARQVIQDRKGAVEDYQKFLDLGGGNLHRNQELVEDWIRMLKI